MDKQIHGRGLLLGLTAALALGLPGTALTQGADPELPPIVLENFETATVKAKPYLWKEGKQSASVAEIGAAQTPLNNDNGNKALTYEYTFSGAFDPADGLEAGPMNQALPGSLSGFVMMVHGDGSKNAIGVRLKDKAGETFEWRIPVTWTGWQKTQVPLDPKLAFKAGTRGNGTLDYPLVFEVVRVSRTQTGARKGEIMVDDVTAVCKFVKVFSLYDTAQGVNPDQWKANRNRSTIGLLADSLVPRNGKDQAVLKMEYEYENGQDASVEFSRTLPCGEGHGTLIAEVCGDGSNNVLRFRMLDGADQVWQQTWASILVDWSGWKTLYLDTRTLRQPNGPDPTAAPDKLPLKFYSIVLDDCSASDALPGVESGRKGEVFLGRLLFGSEK
jgi:hypothetical protein